MVIKLKFISNSVIFGFNGEAKLMKKPMDGLLKAIVEGRKEYDVV